MVFIDCFLRRQTMDLSIFLETNGKPLPHILLGGPSGCGKTKSATDLMKLCNISHYAINAAMIYSVTDLADAIKMASTNNPNSEKVILVIDEIHNLSRGVHGLQQVMLTAIEKYEFKDKNKTYKINPRGWFGNFAVWGMTTNVEKMFPPLVRRFDRVNLELPSTYEKIKLLRSRIPNAGSDSVDVFVKSCVSYRDMVHVIDMAERTQQSVKWVLHQLGFNKMGISHDEREYLKALQKMGFKASLNSIAANMCVERASALEVENRLIRKGIIRIGNCGRELIDG